MNSDYNGFLPDDPDPRPALFDLNDPQRIVQNESDSPIQKLTDEILERNLYARDKILECFIEDPGFVATLDEFEVEFDDLVLKTDPETLRSTDETRIITTQSVRIRRRRKEDDGEAAGVPLGGDPGGEAREG